MTKKQKEREALGNVLRALREERGLTVYKAAQESGLQIGQVQTIEKGDKNYTIDKLFDYLRGCDLTIIIKKKEE